MKKKKKEGIDVTYKNKNMYICTHTYRYIIQPYCNILDFVTILQK